VCGAVQGVVALGCVVESDPDMRPCILIDLSFEDKLGKHSSDTALKVCHANPVEQASTGSTCSPRCAACLSVHVPLCTCPCVCPPEAEAIIKEARAEVSAMVNKQKGEKQSELDKVYAEAKAKVTRETESAIAGGSARGVSSLAAGEGAGA
jgi:hypothetical protein